MKNRIISPGQVWRSNGKWPIDEVSKVINGHITFIILSYVEKNYVKRASLGKNLEWNVVRFHAGVCDSVIETMDEKTIFTLKYMGNLQMMKKYYKIKKINKNERA